MQFHYCPSSDSSLLYFLSLHLNKCHMSADLGNSELCCVSTTSCWPWAAKTAIKAEPIIGQHSSVLASVALCRATEVRKCSRTLCRVDGLQRCFFIISLPRSYSRHISLFLLVTAASSVEAGSCSRSAKLLTSWSQGHKRPIGSRSFSLNTWSDCCAHVIVLQGRKVPAAGSRFSSRCQ